jgi:hypothetical protein
MKKFVLGLLLGLSVPAFAAGGLSTFERCYVSAVTGYVKGYCDKAALDFTKSNPSPTNAEKMSFAEIVSSEITYEGASEAVLPFVQKTSATPKGLSPDMDEYNKVIEKINKECARNDN